MIESVRFKNFKVLKDTTLPLGRFTLIVGPNGSGKSTALQGLGAVLGVGHWNTWASAGTATDQEVFIEVRWADLPQGVVFRGVWDTKGFHDTGFPSARVIQPFRDTLARLRRFTFLPGELAKPTQLSPNVELGTQGLGLAVVLDQLRDADPASFEELNLELSRWLPEFDCISFETLETAKRSLALRTKAGKHKIPAAHLSDGTLLALAILTLAYIPNPPPIVCLEEPDHGIHPRLLRDVQDAIYRLSYPDRLGESRPPIQVIATTQSPYFLDLFRDHPEEVVLAHKTGLEARFERLSDRPDAAEILRDSHLGDAWYSGILGGVPAEMKVAILSESSADEAALRILVGAVLGRSTTPVEMAPPRSRGWPSVRDILTVVIKQLYFRTEAVGLALVVDSDDTSVHEPGHETAPNLRCRLCELRQVTEAALNGLKPVPGRKRLKVAVGLAVPAIEAWYLCGKQVNVSEAAWLQGQRAPPRPYDRNWLKTEVYGTDRPPLPRETERAVAEASRLAQDLSPLRRLFPGGYLPLETELRAWVGEGPDRGANPGG